MSYTLKTELINSSKYNLKCPYKMKPKGICIHETYNDAPAKNEASYMKSNNKSTSFHLVVDDKEVIQCIPYDRNAWASGDGTNGEGNRNYIHIEVCYSKSGGQLYEKAKNNCINYVVKLMREYNFTIDNIKGHCNFSNKNCPHRTNINTYKELIKNTLTVNNNKFYKVVIGSFRNISNANNLLTDLKDKGLDGFISYNNNTKTYRVISGSFKQKQNAQNKLNNVVNKGFKDSFIIYD